jgi:Uncharacterized protein conserved in bacteria
MLIPFEKINIDTLDSLLESHALQEGTEYGQDDIDLSAKIIQLKNQLVKGKIVIVYDEETDSCNVITKQRWIEIEANI